MVTLTAHFSIMRPVLLYSYTWSAMVWLGPQFTSSHLENFFQTWGVSHTHRAMVKQRLLWSEVTALANTKKVNVPHSITGLFGSSSLTSRHVVQYTVKYAVKSGGEAEFSPDCSIRAWNSIFGWLVRRQTEGIMAVSAYMNIADRNTTEVLAAGGSTHRTSRRHDWWRGSCWALPRHYSSRLRSTINCIYSPQRSCYDSRRLTPNSLSNVTFITRSL